MSEIRRGPGPLRTPSARQMFLDVRPQTTADLEAFAAAARTWLDHALGGDIPIAEGVGAARRLLDRAERWAA